MGVSPPRSCLVSMFALRPSLRTQKRKSGISSACFASDDEAQDCGRLRANANKSHRSAAFAYRADGASEQNSVLIGWRPMGRACVRPGATAHQSEQSYGGIT